MTPEKHRDYCPRCGVAYEPLQEYCLECGARLPTNRGVVGVLASSWQRRFAWYPGDWIWPVSFFFVLTIVATAAVLVANAARSSAQHPLTATTPVTVGPGTTTSGAPPVSTSTTPAVPSPTITTGPLPTAPGTGTSPVGTTPTPPNPNALAFWPAGQSGYTNVLESLPVKNGRAVAVQHARRAKRAGLRQVGVLVSSQYSSLHPDYFVVFQGIYETQAEATAALPAAHAKGYTGAYQTRVTR
jgi:hypothetical protein